MPRSTKKQEDINNNKENIQLDDNKEKELENKTKSKKSKAIKTLPNYIEIIVKSNMFGNLIFINEKNGNKVVWNALDDIQYLTVEDIKYMRSNQTLFFEKNWIKLIGIEDEEYKDVTIEQLYKLLGISKYYKVKQFTDELDKIIDLDENNLSSKIDEMNDNEKNLFKNYVLNIKEYYIQKLSYGVIKTLNQKLGLEL